MRYTTRKRKTVATDRQKLVRKLDRLFSRLVRQSAMDAHGMCRCITCGSYRFWKTLDCGHFFSRSCKSLRWDHRNARPQCKGCNGGFRRKDNADLERQEGIHQSFQCALLREGIDVIELMYDARKTRYWTIEELETMRDEFEQMLESKGWEK